MRPSRNGSRTPRSRRACSCPSGPSSPTSRPAAQARGDEPPRARRHRQARAVTRSGVAPSRRARVARRTGGLRRSCRRAQPVGRAGVRRRAVAVAVLAGEAGMGKSRLAAEFAAEVDRSGGRALLGTCFEDAEAPFQPFVQVIADDLSALSEIPFGAAASDTAALARIIPGLARRAGVVATADDPDPVSGQATIAAAVGRYLRRAAGSSAAARHRGPPLRHRDDPGNGAPHRPLADPRPDPDADHHPRHRTRRR